MIRLVLVAFVGALLGALSCAREPECDANRRCPVGEICGSGRTCAPPIGPLETFSVGLPIGPNRDVDLLLMIDNTAQYESFYGELRSLVRALLTGEPGEAVESVRLGVITSDMGTGPDGACRSESGDDGRLLTESDRGSPGCPPELDRWLELTAANVSTSQEITCAVTATGISGCGFEQPLDAILKALVPSDAGYDFPAGATGHADGTNAGFLRDDSVLVILAVSDEDDCSPTTMDLFVEDQPEYSPNLNLRCLHHPEAVRPIERYVEGLLRVRARNPGRLVYAPLAGVPLHLLPRADEPLPPQIDRLLAAPEMQIRPSSHGSTQLEPSCDVPGWKRLHVPQRLIELSRGLLAGGARVSVGSLCELDLADDMRGFADTIRDAASDRGCLPAIDDLGACTLVELSPDPCDTRPGRHGDGMDGRLHRCLIDHDEWRRDLVPQCPDRGALLFTDGATPPPTTRLLFECARRGGASP